ncbi:MAG TPA: hypothetical protein VF224_01805 [Aestuariivirga sp.]
MLNAEGWQKVPFSHAKEGNICTLGALGFHDHSRKDKPMASSAGQKPLILTAAEADHQRFEANARLAESRIRPPDRRSPSPISYIAATLILIVAGYLLFSGNWNTMTMFPTVTETLPAPDVNSLTPPPTTAPKYTPPVAP